MFTWFIQGGVCMYPLLVCSVIAMAIVIERSISLRIAFVIPEDLGKVVLERQPASQSFELSKKYPSALATIIQGMYQERSLHPDAQKHLFKTLFTKEVATLERGLTWLEIVASIAPLLGLLGTVLGMVDIFNVIVTMGVGQAKALAGGISQALITTIAGLCIAIPTMVFHSCFSKRSEQYAMQLEEYSHYFVHTLEGK